MRCASKRDRFESSGNRPSGSDTSVRVTSVGYAPFLMMYEMREKRRMSGPSERKLDNAHRGITLTAIVAALRVTAFRWLVQAIAVVALISGSGRIWFAPTGGSPETPAVTSSAPRTVHAEKAAAHEQATPRVARAPLLGRLPPVVPGSLLAPLGVAATTSGAFLPGIAPSAAGVETFFVRRRIPRMGSEEPPRTA